MLQRTMSKEWKGNQWNGKQSANNIPDEKLITRMHKELL